MPDRSHRKTAVVTGFPGWLGNHLVRRLLQEGWRVTTLINPEFKSRVSRELRGKLRLVSGDVRDQESLLPLFRSPVEAVFHCVGVIHPKTVADFYRTNTLGTQNLARLAAGQTGRFIYISSNAAAGFSDRLGRPMRETDLPHPESPYGKSKLLAEAAVEATGVNSVILRPSMYIGREQPERMTRLMQMVKNGRVPIFGLGNYPRSFTVIENLVDAMLLAARHPKAGGQTFWIVSERPYTTIEFLRLIAKHIGVPFRPRYFPAGPAIIAQRLDQLTARLGIYHQTLHILGETTRSIAVSGEKARRILGYKPRLTVTDGVKQAVDWAREQGLI